MSKNLGKRKYPEGEVVDPPEKASPGVRRRYQQHNYEVRKKRRMAEAALDLTAQVGAPNGEPDPNRESPDRKVEPEIKTGDEEGTGEQLAEDPLGDQQHDQVIEDVHGRGEQRPQPSLEKMDQANVLTDQATIPID